MKKTLKLLVLALAAVLLFAACGDADSTSQNDKTDKNDGDDTTPSINYEDYIDPVVDRKVTDLITEMELSDIMDVEVTAVIAADSTATYQSENGYYSVTLMLENKTRADFDALASDTTAWTPQAGVGEAAYWGVDQTELIAYQNGYAVSVSGYHVYYGCLQTIMEHLLDNLQ